MLVKINIIEESDIWLENIYTYQEKLSFLCQKYSINLLIFKMIIESYKHLNMNMYYSRLREIFIYVFIYLLASQV